MPQKIKTHTITYYLVTALLLICGSVSGQATSLEPSKTTVWNVKDHHAQGDGQTDDTGAIQQTIGMASAGDTVWIPEGTYRVRALGLRSGVHIKADGTLVQQLDSTQEFTNGHQNSSAPLFRGKDISNVSISLNAQALHEAIYLSGSRNVTIYDSHLSGDSTKFRSFSGILLYKCANISIGQTSVMGFGTDRRHTDSYQPGTGIRILESKEVTIQESTIRKNGENGIFIHASPDITVFHSDISYNGMSGIQVAFGTSGVEKNYRFENNTFHCNASDAVDINNRGPKGPQAIHAAIINNDSRDNGFVDGKSTPDGSGIATLVNVSDVEVIANQAKGNNRPAIYMEDCGEILVKDNVADNQVELVGGLKQLNMLSNVFSNVTFIDNVHAQYICMENNQLTTLHLPNGIRVDSLLINENELANASININLLGNIELLGNRIVNEGKNPTLLLVKADGIRIANNHILSHRAPALTIHASAKDVLVKENTIRSANTCIIDQGAVNLRIEGNKLTALETGSHYFTLRSKNPQNLQLTGNEHTGKEEYPVIFMEGKGTARLNAEKIIRGTTEFGEIKVATSNL
ncbi:endopolygalacturonase [Echinicola soli]|uniref:Endopolygalacturonase n=1 Tax=Echinicola soli TaxID=2591634 RepID=A0A514CMS9_9BACT|nr:right-handed parallel beta-helix repeat-containing protein [Echinicola soli]QDH81111.1 endopolygalacturonase [Echinicola soli]